MNKMRTFFQSDKNLTLLIISIIFLSILFGSLISFKTSIAALIFGGIVILVLGLFIPSFYIFTFWILISPFTQGMVLNFWKRYS